MTLTYFRSLPVCEPHDLAVCGGGPSGLAAALAAGRSGLKVLLIESAAQLGGMATSGLVAHWLGGRTADSRNPCVGGLFQELVREAVARGAALDPLAIPPEKYSEHGWKPFLAAGVPLDPFALAPLLDEQAARSGVAVLLATQVVDAVVEGDRITHVVISNKSGLSAVPAKAFVDATGDADVAARTGCETVKGRAGDGLTAPATLEFHVEHVDVAALRNYIYEHDSPRLRELIQALKTSGDWPFAYDIFVSVRLTEPDTMMINTPCLCGIDGTDGRSVTRGILQGRQEVWRLFSIMRRHFPGFSNARIKAVAPALGVRETRRLVGEFVYRVEDILEARTFDDTIALSGYGWDLADPRKPTLQPMHSVDMLRPYTPIPYRCLVPRPIRNLICPGRAVSVERDVLGPLRVMAPCMAMGEAAGRASLQVVREGRGYRDVDVRRLQADLREHGAILDWPPA